MSTRNSEDDEDGNQTTKLHAAVHCHQSTTLDRPVIVAESYAKSQPRTQMSDVRCRRPVKFLYWHVASGI
ncbi:MAG TPA: hypothetical protein VGC91_19710 [Pyrinomonadaceae bacterium]